MNVAARCVIKNSSVIHGLFGQHDVQRAAADITELFLLSRRAATVNASTERF